MLALLASAVLTASIVVDADNEFGALTVIRNNRQIWRTPPPKTPRNSPPEGLAFGKFRFIASGTNIINRTTHQSLDVGPISQQIYPGYPSPLGALPVLRPKFATALGSSVLWLWSWGSFDMGDSSGNFFLVSFRVAADGSFRQVDGIKLADLATLYSRISLRRSRRNWAFIGGYSTVVLDVSSWKVIRSFPQMAFPGSKSTLYFQNGEETLVQPYDLTLDRLGGEIPVNLGSLGEVITTPEADLLVFSQGLLNVRSRAEYAYPKGVRDNDPNPPERLEYVPHVGVAVLDLYHYGRKKPGVILEVNRLRPICDVVAKPASEALPRL